LNANLFRLLTDVGENTAIDIEHMTVNGVRCMRSEEHSGASELRRIEPTTSRRLGADE
jgi:hypothetical protein